MLTGGITLVSNFFSLPIKIQGDSNSFDIAQSEYDNQIALSPKDMECNSVTTYVTKK